MEVEEESSIGTLVGYLTAYDPDIGENALIDYIITGMLLKITIKMLKFMIVIIIKKKKNK